MSGRAHEYATVVEWTGSNSVGTTSYTAYERRHEIADPAGRKPNIPGSSDPVFRGDASRWNPEDLLVASLSACHKLSYLHLCAVHGVVVTEYVDRATGVMEEDGRGGGRFTSVVLRPRVTITAESDPHRAEALHAEAHARCFIASSVNFDVRHEGEIVVR